MANKKNCNIENKINNEVSNVKTISLSHKSSFEKQNIFEMEHVEVETKIRKASKISLNSKGENNIGVISSNNCNNVHKETCNTTRDSSNGNSKNSMESNEENLKIKKYSIYSNNTNNTINNCEYSEIRKNSMKENSIKETKVKPSNINKIKETNCSENKSDSQVERKNTLSSKNSMTDEDRSKFESLE